MFDKVVCVSGDEGKILIANILCKIKPEWQLRLYVAGQTAKSIAALANLKRLCDAHLAGRYEIEVIDLLENPRLAAGDQILVVPTLVRKLPEPIKKIIGDLSQTALVEWGAAVTAVASGREALALIEGAVFDALVCDIAMPEMDGYEVIGRLRAMGGAPERSHLSRLPAVALTALARPEDRMQSLAAGFQMHVAKPVEPAELIMVIATLTRSHRQGAMRN